VRIYIDAWFGIYYEFIPMSEGIKMRFSKRHSELDAVELGVQIMHIVITTNAWIVVDQRSGDPL